MLREDTPLLEREAELAMIAERLGAACEGGGALLMVEGAAGIGKTRLIRATCEQGRACGMTVLTARGGELERGLPFGVVRELLAAPVRGVPATERAALLAGAAELAAPVLGLATESAAPSPDDAAFSGLHGLYWMTVNLAERRPLLLAVDDAHWADEASLRFLVYLLRRLEALPLLLVVAGRTDEPGADEVLLEAMRANPLTWALQPAPLSEPAAASVVRAAFSPKADAELCRVCFSATDGNPLLLRMLSHALREAEVDPVRGRDRVAELAPRVVAAWVLPRLRRLPVEAAAFAGAVAVLGDRVELRHAAALAGLATGPATRATDALVAARILADGCPIEFIHPTVRRAVYDNLSSAERHRAHRQAAEVLESEAAPPDRIAAHLLVTERLGDDWVVDVLRAAARTALGRGAVDDASRYLRRALEEPPHPRLRADVLLELGSVAARTDIDEAYRYLERALDLAVGVRQRAAIALALAQVMGTSRDNRSALAVLDRAVAEVGDADSALGVRLEAQFITVARRYAGTRAQASRRLRALAGHAEPGGLTGCILLANRAADALEEKGAVGEATRLANAALHEDHLLENGETDVALMASSVLMSTDRLDAAWRAWNAEIDRARRTGSIIGFAGAATVRACLAYRCGQLADAEADARLADDVIREHGRVLMRRYSLTFLIGALVERGEVEVADELLAEAAVPMNLSLLLHTRGRLRAAQGRFAEAVEDFLACGRRLVARGTQHPGLLAWRSDAALALLRIDQAREARRLAEEELDLARRLGIPRALGIVWRATGLIRGGSAGLALLEDAATVLTRSSARLEEARALADFGAALRRANRRTESRDPLHRALDLANRCGATPIADQARQDLLAAGARPRRAASGVHALTPSELPVARMAADGMGNRAIAQALFVTVKTVEVHLSSVYRKLDVPSRAALAAALADDVSALPQVIPSR
jgi:DNA-binding CsgD family transcriptional regulator